jgi:hypothetical protein
MSDTFARTSATKAHKRATEAAVVAREARELVLELVGERTPGHQGRCCLCGQQASTRYCHAHRWAA